MKNETLPWALTTPIVLRFYFGQYVLQEGSVQWSVWIAREGVTDRDRALCLSMSASWPLQQSILFMQKVICPCANCPRQTYMHTHIISSAHPSLSIQLSMSFCLCALSFSLTPTEWCCQGYLACQNRLFGFTWLFSLYACFVLLPVLRCLWAACALRVSLFCPEPNWTLVKFPHPSFTYLWIDGEEMDFQRISPLFCKSEGFTLLPHSLLS